MKTLDKILVYVALTALVLLCLVQVAPADFDVTRDMLSGGVIVVKAKTPLSVGTNYRMTAPAAPTVVTSATTDGSCNTTVRRWYWGCVNEGGVVLGAASADWTPSPALRRPTVTRAAPCPANAKGQLVYFSEATDGHAAKYLTQATTPATLELGFIPLATTSVTPDCATAGAMTYASAPLAGFRAHVSINVVGEGIVGRASFAGGNINLLTEDANQSDLSMLNNGTLVLQSTTAAAPANGFKLDADTGTIDTYKAGTLTEINRGDSWRPPPCPADVQGMGVGLCFDMLTGKIKVKDAVGVRDL